MTAFAGGSGFFGGPPRDFTDPFADLSPQSPPGYVFQSSHPDGCRGRDGHSPDPVDGYPPPGAPSHRPKTPKNQRSSSRGRKKTSRAKRPPRESSKPKTPKREPSRPKTPKRGKSRPRAAEYDRRNYDSEPEDGQQDLSHEGIQRTMIEFWMLAYSLGGFQAVIPDDGYDEHGRIIRVEWNNALRLEEICYAGLLDLHEMMWQTRSLFDMFDDTVPTYNPREPQTLKWLTHSLLDRLIDFLEQVRHFAPVRDGKYWDVQATPVGCRCDNCDLLNHNILKRLLKTEDVVHESPYKITILDMYDEIRDDTRLDSKFRPNQFGGRTITDYREMASSPSIQYVRSLTGLEGYSAQERVERFRNSLDLRADAYPNGYHISLNLEVGIADQRQTFLTTTVGYNYLKPS